MKPPGTEPLLSQWGWQARAACRGMDTAVFFSPCGEQGLARRTRERRARAVCRECPVRPACASFAMRTGQDFGVWGGLTEADRQSARSAPTHVLIRGVQMFSRIVLAVDDSDARQRAVTTAAELARHLGSTVHVLHLAPTAVVGTSVVALEDEADARRVLDESVRALREAGVPADGELLDGLRGQVPAVIAAAAERLDAELIVLAPHHRGAVASWFSPSVSAAVGHASRVPVLLVPDTD